MYIKQGDILVPNFESEIDYGPKLLLFLNSFILCKSLTSPLVSVFSDFCQV